LAYEYVLFNLALEKVIGDSSMETKGNMLNKSVQILAYADDVDIVGRTKNAVKKAYTTLLKAARRMGH
jgi:sorting nexin-29